MRYFSFKLNFSLVENSLVTTRKTRLWRRDVFLTRHSLSIFISSNKLICSNGEIFIPIYEIRLAATLAYPWNISIFFLFIYLFFKFFCSLFCFVLVVVVERWYWKHRERPESDLCEKELKTCLQNADVFPVVERRWGSFL